MAVAPGGDNELAAPPGDSYDRRDVLAAIGDRVALAKSWGLRLAGSHPNRDGWIPCHRIGSEDRNPSAAFHVGGWYWDHTPESRAWAKRYFAKMKKQPSMLQAGDYSATMQFLNAVKALGTDNADKVMAH